MTKQSFLGLAKHFVYDIFHFDGKFFETLRHLFFQPGTISLEYVSGKRMRYLDPIRMYLFTSAVFFLVFFSIESTETVANIDGREVLSKARRLDLAMAVKEEQVQKPSDTVLQQQMQLLLDSSYVIGLAPPSDTSEYHSMIQLEGKSYRFRAWKDSSIMPFGEPVKGWFARTLQKKWIQFYEKYKDDLNSGLVEFIKSTVHKLPYLLFVSLPFFAGILKLLYLRRRNYYYNDHAVFTLHHYIISFILMLFFFGLDALGSTTGWGVFNYFAVLMIFLWPLYLLFGMKRFYQQRWRTTLGKFLLVNLLGMIALLVLLAGFILFSFFQL